MTSCTYDVVPLDDANVRAAAPLLAEYKHGDAPVTDAAMAECKESWRRLILTGHSYGLLARCRETGEYAAFVTYSWGFSSTKGMPVLRIQDVFTASRRRRTGASEALLARTETIAREAGAHRLQLETDVDNAAARALYEKAGYRPIEPKLVYMRPLVPPP
ncbi:GNAT family N-acetyltransferase [Paenibacillus flagellatus]|uniref:N-acetyltransferase domain-containing protein n=1 Tax=Paenibacillus flagellatus TaxID=2211139 RepID=A0A2V5KK88_9BACL|nr:GNAT family N-acetyltransferase [Paenibacillus flagellatus]PYI55210.1 hypothetical protein DLM86_11850 [Paenibacillus flagellatus]